MVAEIAAQGLPQAYFYRMDVTDRELVYATAALVIEQVGKVDILINNAGIVDGKPILEGTDAMVERTMNVNATSHVWTIKAFLPGMLQRNKGNIVSIASAAGAFGCAGMVDYSASKFAAVGIMVSLRQEIQMLGKNGVHCTLVCPSFINTGMFEGVQPPRFTSWLSPEYVANKVVQATRRNQWRLLMPRMLYMMEFMMTVLPDRFAVALINLAGVTDSMKHFKQTRPHASAKGAKQN